VHNVFISYSTKDQKIVDTIVDYLESNNIKCWIACRNTVSGESYAASIVKAIKATKVFLLVLSENSNSSSHVLNEVDTACKYKKIIIPFKIDDTELVDAMEYYLNATHWFDTINAPLDVHGKNLASVINKYLGYTEFVSTSVSTTNADYQQQSTLKLVSGTDITEKDIREALLLDHKVFDLDESVHFTPEKCLAWLNINPDIYFMLKNTTQDTVVGYANVAPVTKECYEKILTGETWDIEISEDDVLSYDFPGIYYLNFTSIVIHPSYRNSGALVQFIDAIIDKILELSSHEIYFKEMVADALTQEGEKFCRLFGMQLTNESKHQSKIYSVSLLPPKFKQSSKSITKLFKLYEQLEIDDLI